MAQDIWSLSRRGDNESLKRVLGPPSEDWSMRTISLDPVANKKGAKLRGARMQERVRWSGATALHRAAANGHLETCKMLVDQYGVKVDERAAWGWYTPLHLAAKAGHEKVCDFLISRGGRWDAKDKYGRRCFDYAVEGHHTIMAWTMQRAMDAYEQQQYKLLTTMTMRGTQGLPQDGGRRSFRSSVVLPPVDDPLFTSTNTPSRLSISMRGTELPNGNVTFSSGMVSGQLASPDNANQEKEEEQEHASLQQDTSRPSSSPSTSALGPTSSSFSLRSGGAKGLSSTLSPSSSSSRKLASPSTPTRKARVDLASVALARTTSPSSPSSPTVRPSSGGSARKFASTLSQSSHSGKSTRKILASTHSTSGRGDAFMAPHNSSIKGDMLMTSKKSSLKGELGADGSPSPSPPPSAGKGRSGRNLGTTLGSPKSKSKNKRPSTSPSNRGSGALRPQSAGKKEGEDKGGKTDGPCANEGRGAHDGERAEEKEGGVEVGVAPLDADERQEGEQREQSREAGEREAEDGEERGDDGQRLASEDTEAWEGNPEGVLRGQNGTAEYEDCVATEGADGVDLRGEREDGDES